MRKSIGGPGITRICYAMGIGIRRKLSKTIRRRCSTSHTYCICRDPQGPQILILSLHRMLAWNISQTNGLADVMGFVSIFLAIRGRIGLERCLSASEWNATETTGQPVLCEQRSTSKGLFFSLPI